MAQRGMVPGERVLQVLFLALMSCQGGQTDSNAHDLVGRPDQGPACRGHEDCEDGDPCTKGICVKGICEQEPVSCDDQNICTEDFCEPGVGCSHKAKPNCCNGDADCDDHDPCTFDSCMSHVCLHDRKDPTCCSEDSQCDDGDDCTFDICDSGHCLSTKITGPGACCLTNTDCLDGDPCTDDFCKDGHCVYVNAGCCSKDEDCEDNNPCTEGKCTEKQKCEYTWKPGCCITKEDCDDGNPCTVEACNSGTCEVVPLKNCCKDDSDCVSGDPCKKGTCLIPSGETSGECKFTLLDTPECCTTLLMKADFDDGSLQGFEISNLYGEGGPTFQVDSKRSYSPPNSLYFGDPVTHTYDAGITQPVGASAIGPEVDLSKTMAPELRFMLWKETEVVASADVLSVSIQSDGKTQEVFSTALQTQYANTEGEFVKVVVALSAFSEKKVRVVFTFDTKNGFANSYEGVYLDDVEIVGKCK